MKFQNGLYYVTNCSRDLKEVLDGPIEAYAECDFDECKWTVFKQVDVTGDVGMFIFNDEIYTIDCNQTVLVGAANEKNIEKSIEELVNLEKSWIR